MVRNLLYLRIVLLMLASCAGVNIRAQIIGNPDFESYTTCPSQHSRFVNNVTNWLVSLGAMAGTPDYYNACGYKMPDKIVAQSGDGYAGCYAELNNTFTDYKEYFTCNLSTPLQAGITYTFSFYTGHIYGSTPPTFPPPTTLTFVELPDAEQGFLGAVFSTAAPVAANTVGNTTPRYNSIRDDFGSGRVLIPKTNTDVYGPASRNTWVRVTLQYTAVGGEQFMTMGQFRPGGTSLPAGHGAYYVFDNFSSSLQVLPVRLQSFSVKKINNTAHLEWTTASEQNNSGFEVQRSADGESWNTLGFVQSKAANGNSSIELDYEYVDPSPVEGDNLYRLKQTDRDGRFVYSNVNRLSFEGQGLVLHPNPVSSELFIRGLKNVNSLQVFNLQGQVVKSLTVTTSSTMRIDVSSLPAGVYTIRANLVNGESASYKFVRK